MSGLSDSERTQVRAVLTVKNPQVAQIERFSGWVPKDVPRHIFGYVDDGDDILIAPGAAARIWRMFTGWYDDQKIAPAVIPMDYTGEIRSYQERAIWAYGKAKFGTIVSPCGSGKTNLGVFFVTRHKCRTLVIVPTRELMRQWRDRFASVSTVRAVCYGGGRRAKRDAIFGDEPVIIATVQSLRASPGMLRLMHETREFVIIDEGHRTPAATYTEVLSTLDPTYRLAITATPDRADGLGPLIEWWCGPVRATVTREELEDGGFVMRPRLIVYPVETLTCGYDPDEPGDHGRLMEKVGADELRLEHICLKIVGSIEGDRLTNCARRHMIRSSSVDYGKKIAERIGAPMIDGKLPKAQRDAAITVAIAGGSRAVVVTSLADEGLDWPALTDVWLVTPLKSAAKVEQAVGRCMRPCDGKPTPVIHDFIDVNVSRKDKMNPEKIHRVFVNMFRSRLKVYRQIADVDDAACAQVLGWGK